MANVERQENQKENQKALEDADVPTLPSGAPDTRGFDPFTALSTSATAATGDIVKVPKTPKEIAQQGTELGLAGDFSTGGNIDPTAGRDAGTSNTPTFSRVWAMDADQTVANRNDPDSFKPDCSVRTS